MNAEVWSSLKPILAAALALPTSARAAFLDRSCQGRPDLHGYARSLLSEQLGDFLEEGPALELAPAHGHANELPDVVGQQVAGVRLVRMLACGGMAAVFLGCSESGPERHVAVKVPFRGDDAGSTNRRIEQEFGILRRFDHPHVVRPMGIAPLGDAACLVMEHVDGVPIDAYCEAHGLGVPERVDLMLGICSALEHVHQRGVVHNDLKPANVLVSASGSPKLLDFGIASGLNTDPIDGIGTPPADEDVVRLGDHHVAFTPECASPEQLRHLPSGPASDVYAMGILLSRLLTGRHPHEHSGPVSLLQRMLAVHRRDPLPPSALVRLSGVPRAIRGLSTDDLAKVLEAGLDRVVARALARDPSMRYGSAAELRSDLLDARP